MSWELHTHECLGPYYDENTRSRKLSITRGRRETFYLLLSRFFKIKVFCEYVSKQCLWIFEERENNFMLVCKIHYK